MAKLQIPIVKKNQREIYLNLYTSLNSETQLKTLSKYIVATAKREFYEATDYNSECAGKLFVDEQAARKSLRVNDFFLVLKVDARAIQINQAQAEEADITIKNGFIPQVIGLKTRSHEYKCINDTFKKIK